MKKDRISYHESVLKLHERIKADGVTNIWDRFEAQGMGATRTGGAPSAWAV